MSVETLLMRVVLPYCLQRQADGRYAVLNRRYQPIGTHLHSTDALDLAARGHLLQLAPIDAHTAARLSAYGKPETDCIYLYASGHHPLNDPIQWAAYCARLHTLGSLDAGPATREPER
jgi:hypothetical protein